MSQRTQAAEAAAPVPPLTIDLTGSSYGGQYWSPREYRAEFTARPDGITVHVEAADGSPVEHLEYDREATLLLAYPIWARPEPEPVNASRVRGLTLGLSWRLGSDTSDTVELAHHLPEIGEWLRYAVGVQTWDPANPDWEY